jgi:hypothetical protein
MFEKLFQSPDGVTLVVFRASVKQLPARPVCGCLSRSSTSQIGLVVSIVRGMAVAALALAHERRMLVKDFGVKCYVNFDDDTLSDRCGTGGNTSAAPL